MSVEDEITKLQKAYQGSVEKDRLYEELLEDYKIAKKRIEELEEKVQANSSNQLPTKDDVEAMSGMLDLINKLDDATIEKLSKFGNK